MASDDKKTNLVHKEIQLFTSHLESIKETLPLSTFVIEHSLKKRADDFKEFINKQCEINSKEGGRWVIVKPEHNKIYKIKECRVDRLKMAKVLLPRSLFVSMISQYDAYMGRLLKVFFTQRPETIFDSERSFQFKEICKFETLEEFREDAINKEVESILRCSHEEQINQIQKKFKMSITSSISSWSNFLEISERRNLFVHADGIVSKRYIDLCNKHNLPTDEMIEGKTSLKVSFNYFEQAYKCLYETGLKLGYLLWRKLLKDDLEVIDDSFNDIVFNLIESDQFDLASDLFGFFCKEGKDKFHSEKNYLITVINCAQSHKWAGRNDKCLEIIKDHDWSAKSDDFRLANAVLNESWNESAEIVKKIGKSLEMERCYRDWPLFKQLIKQDIFLVTYKSIFEKDFEIQHKKL
jgi:hypothetical protein